jgi:hypothetical protein
MKDIQFTAKRQKQELYWLCASVAASFVLNVYAIIAYQTEWKELWTQSVRVVCIGAGFYALSVLIRCISGGIRRLLKLLRRSARGR